MRNVLDRRFAENQNTYFVFKNFSPNRAVCEIMSKNMVETEGSEMTSRMVHTSFMLYKQGHMHVRACKRPRAWAHARTLGCTHTYIIFIFLHGNNDSRQLLSVTLYVLLFSCLHPGDPKCLCMSSFPIKILYVTHF
jgi:hypothetical protein